MEDIVYPYAFRCKLCPTCLKLRYPSEFELECRQCFYCANHVIEEIEEDVKPSRQTRASVQFVPPVIQSVKVVEPKALPVPSSARNVYFENIALQRNLLRAKQVNAPATLTLDQWIFTLDYFEWKCAYCRVRDHAYLEHFIPVRWGGGTVKDNCVPTCQGCNARKSGYHPLINLPQSLNGMRNDIQRVCKYLRMLREQETIQLSLVKSR